AELTSRIRKATGTIRVVEAPDGATVLLDGKELPSLVVRPVYVAAGSHTVGVTHADFAPFKKQLKVDVGDAALVKPDLVARPRDAAVHVVAKPGDASVLVDGKPPASPKAERGGITFSVRPGAHEVSIRKPGMTAVDTTLELRGGETREVSAELYAAPP